MIRLVLILALLTLNVGCSLNLPNPPWVETSLEISPITRTDYDTSLDGQLATLTRQVSKQLTGLSCKNIGVLQIVDLKGEEGNFEKYIKNELVNRLSRTSKFRVFPIDELTEDVVESSKSFLDKILYLFKREPVYLTGITVELPKGIKVGIQITSIESGQVLGTASMLFRKDNILLGIMGHNFEEKVINNTSNPSHFKSHQSGRVIKVSDNDYVELIHDVYTLYIKRINYEYSLFTDEESTVEIFLNDDYRIMSTGDMINFSYGSHQFILSLHRVTDHKALFTFANLSETIDEDSETVTSFEIDKNNNLSFNDTQKAPLLNSQALSYLNQHNKTARPIKLPLKYGFFFIVSIAPPINLKLLYKSPWKYFT